MIVIPFFVSNISAKNNTFMLKYFKILKLKFAFFGAPATKRVGGGRVKAGPLSKFEQVPMNTELERGGGVQNIIRYLILR